MAICIDSALIENVKGAHSRGWVRGVTTNTILLATAGGDVRATLESLAHLEIGKTVVDGNVTNENTPVNRGVRPLLMNFGSTVFNGKPF